jgi:hypothetical protein
MAVATVGAGRPYSVAEIPFQNARKVALLDEFYRICATFHYPEQMALSRALGVTDRTVRRWRYRESFPRWDIAIDVIEWVNQGKPIRKEHPSQSSGDML